MILGGIEDIVLEKKNGFPVGAWARGEARHMPTSPTRIATCVPALGRIGDQIAIVGDQPSRPPTLPLSIDQLASAYQF